MQCSVFVRPRISLRTTEACYVILVMQGQAFDPGERLVAEAGRIYERYAREVIEAHSFCPWAAEARRDGSVSVTVVLGQQPAPDEISALANALDKQDKIIIGLMVFPQLDLDALRFQHFAAQVRTQMDANYPRGEVPWAMADFHPQGVEDLSSAERAVAFVRRSPDPTLQLVRHSTLSALRRQSDGGTQFIDMAKFDPLESVSHASRPALHERVAQNNLRKLGDVAQAVTKTLADIHRDRNLSYARVGLPVPTWSS